MKRMRNVPVHYNEIKKNRHIVLTDTVWNALKESALQQVISPSELIERLARSYCNVLTEKSSDCTFRCIAFLPPRKGDKLPALITVNFTIEFRTAI